MSREPVAGGADAAPAPQRYLLTLEYDGAAFCGWQRQVGCLSVQEALEQALRPLCGRVATTVVGAGRTDAGVHATGQRAHFDTLLPRPAEVYRRALNVGTPETLSVTAVLPVATTLHARFSALYREYHYQLHDRAVPSPLRRGRVWQQGRPLKVGAMAEAARCLVGEHDFSALRASSCQSPSPVRRVTRLEVVREGDEVRVVIGANAFLHHMVRNVVGCLAKVGRGEWPVARLAEVLASRDRRLAAPTAPPQGLTLVRVVYPGEEGA